MIVLAFILILLSTVSSVIYSIFVTIGNNKKDAFILELQTEIAELKGEITQAAETLKRAYALADEQNTLLWKYAQSRDEILRLLSIALAVRPNKDSN